LHLFFVVALQVYFALPSLQGFLFSFHRFVHFAYNFIYFALACFFYKNYLCRAAARMPIGTSFA
jgi:hypothetical protein